MTPQPTIEQIAELDQHVTKLKSHIQQVKNDAFKVIADCESMSITLASHPAPSPCVQCLEEDRVSMMEHDAAIAAQAREKVLDEVKQYADTCIWVGDDCCPGKMNDQEESDCDGCSYVDYPNNADICEKIISLRRTEGGDE